jgi:hypothetical protein
MGALLRDKLLEVLRAVAPLVAIVCILQVALVDAPAALFVRFLAGAVLAIAGMVLLFVGVDLGILPMGRFVGAELPQRGSLKLIVLVALALGYATTAAEPDVLVLAAQVDAASEGAIGAASVRNVVAAGVALFVAIGMLRIVYGWRMATLLTVAYAAAILLALLAPAELVPLAFDAGSVTTGVLTAPVVIALAVGLASVLAGRSALADGFGILGFASVGPIIAVLVMSMLGR